MRKRFRVKKYKWASRKYVVEGRENGKRRRKFFETRAEAQSYADLKNIELENRGREHAEFDSRLRDMAQDCADKLKAFGKTIADATHHYVEHLRASERSCTVKQLLAELLDAKESKGVSRRHLDDLRQRAGRFAESFGDRIAATITSREVEEWLDSLNVGPQTRNHYRSAVRLMFNFAVRRGYAATENPTAKIEKANVLRPAPGILTVAQSAHLLENASPEILPYIAIGLFAGLRTAEIMRLDWSEIDFESGLIKVAAEKAKTAQKRFASIQPNLREWLLPLRRHSGKVAPDNFRKLFDEARAAASIELWPSNAMRHSYASYHLAHFQNAARTAMELGHHDSRITYAHYRELVKPKDAERYWNIRPAKASKKIVQLAAQQ
jgi:integrase